MESKEVVDKETEKEGTQKGNTEEDRDRMVGEKDREILEKKTEKGRD